MPVIRGGETYALPRDWTETEALAYGRSPDQTIFVADDGGVVVGTCYIHSNQRGGGAHVANAAFMTRTPAAGSPAPCVNMRCALWQRFGFEVVGRLPEAFRHPADGFVDALVMYR